MAARNKPAATKHDDLWAKALVIEDAAGHRAVLVTLDLVGIPRELSLSVCKQIEKNVQAAAVGNRAVCVAHAQRSGGSRQFDGDVLAR